MSLKTQLRLTLLAAPILMATFAANAASPTEVTASLTADIKSAQKQLNKSQTRIANERASLAKSLNSLELKVLALREQAAVAQRLNDERTLSLQQLQQRLERWQQQQAYQNNLIKRFNQQFAQANEAAQQNPMQQVLAIAKSAGEGLQPSWQKQNLVQKDGHIAATSTLRVGPSTWFWQSEQNRGGFVVEANGLLQEGLALSGGDSRNLANLFNNGQGTIAIDPSLKHATQLGEQNEGAAAHVAKGGLWAIPIVAFALFALSIALAKTWQLWRLPKLQHLSRGALTAAINSGKAVPTIKGAQAELLAIAQQEAKGQSRDDQLFNALQNSKHKLERFLGAIAVTASVAPLLGLLGTVSGMIETFKMMTLFGAGDPQVVSGGISQALITTELGLIVAIPALILNALLSRWAKRHYEQLEQFALQLSDPASPTEPPTKTVKPKLANTNAEALAV